MISFLYLCTIVLRRKLVTQSKQTKANKLIESNNYGKERKESKEDCYP